MIGTVIGTYRFDEQLGEGGMGVVYKATDLSLERTVAIKVLSPDLSRSPDLVQRFRSEARAQANLNHVNLATLYTFLVHEGRALMVMEYIQGETVDHMVMRRGPIPSQDAIPIFKQALLGIGCAHRAGVIHRDVKPSNIMLNGQGIVKVMDFGIAKVMGNRGLTRTGTQMGTPYYMSPEQVMNNPVDIRSDIYSLGITLYEMLSAHVPFAGDSDYQILSAHVNTAPPPPTRYYPYIPRGIQNAVFKALEKDPGARFQSVEEFGAALERSEDFTYASSFPVSASVAAAAPQAAPPPIVHKQQTPPPISAAAPTAYEPTRTIPQFGTAYEAPHPLPPPEMRSPVVGVKPPFWTRPRIAVAGICLLLVLLLIGWLIPNPNGRRGPSTFEPSQQATSPPAKSSGSEGQIEVPMPSATPSETPPSSPAGSGTAPTSATTPDVKVENFRADSPSIKAGQKAHLSWSVKGATVVTISPGIGAVKPEGSVDIPLHRSTEFKLVATRADGYSVSSRATVNVEDAPAAPVRLTATFGAQADRIRAGQNAVLSWSVPGASEVSITPGVGTVPAQGTVRVAPTQTTQYLLTARGPGAASTTSVATIVVDPAPAAKAEIAFDVVPNAIHQGQSATLRWSLTNARTAIIEPEPGPLHQVSGQYRVTPSSTTTYRLTAHAADGTATTAQATVQVAPNAPVAPPPPVAAAGHIFNVVHDHAGALGGNNATWLSCWGQLQVAGNRLRYHVLGTADGRRDDFDIALSDIQEAKLNRLNIRMRPAFHLKVGGQTLNFVPANATTSQVIYEIDQSLHR